MKTYPYKPLDRQGRVSVTTNPDGPPGAIMAFLEIGSTLFTFFQFDEGISLHPTEFLCSVSALKSSYSEMIYPCRDLAWPLLKHSHAVIEVTHLLASLEVNREDSSKRPSDSCRLSCLLY